jgi:Arc/MetJ-type ribon-helix-helix transcriptional regulator
MSEPKNVTVSTKITLKTRKAINEIIMKDTHLNESDFIRSAIREKILRDAPYLLEKMLEE